MVPPPRACGHCNNGLELRYSQVPSIVDKLRSNYAPVSPPEVQDLTSLITSAETHFQSCIHQIQQLESVLQRLLEEKQSTERFIAEHKSLLAPIRHLPAEILLSIFEYCCDLPWSDWVVPPTLDVVLARKAMVSLAPYRLATVCRLWRDLATSNAQLWSSMLLDLDEMEEKDLEIFRTTLQRSAQEKLYICLKKMDSEDGPMHAEKCQAALVLNAHRIRHLHIAGDDDPFDNPFDDTVVSLPSLVSFDFRSEISDEGGGNIVRFPWLASATSLRSVHFCDAGRLLLFFNDITDKLTSLTSCDRVLSQSLRILPRFSASLKICRIDVDFLDKIEENIELRFPFLTDLTLSNNLSSPELFNIGWYLNHLHTPNLDTFSLFGDNQPIVWSLNDIKTFISRSGIKERLHCLKLRGLVPISDEVFQGTMQLMPALRHLMVFEDEGKGHLVSIPLLERLAIIHGGTPSPILPRLSTLEMRIYENPERLDPLLSLLECRAPHGRVFVHQSRFEIEPLRNFWFKLVTQTGKENLERFDECQKLGIRVLTEVVTVEERATWLEMED